MTKLKTRSTSRCRILLIDNSPHEKRIRAIMLHTHGYDVELTANPEDAYLFCRAEQPDLVLLSLRGERGAELQLWNRIKRSNPLQRIAFLINNSLHHNPVITLRDPIPRPDDSADLVEGVRTLLVA
jgi:DNA-binding NtrC family response regulator